MVATVSTWGAMIAGSLILASAAGAAPQPRAARLLLPPTSIEPATEATTIRTGSRIGYPANDAEAADTARLLVEHIGTTRGIALIAAPGDGTLQLVRNAAVGGLEGCRPDVAPRGVRIVAATSTGLIYGVMTLAQLARAGKLDFGATAAEPSNNGLDLLPGESRTVPVTAQASPAVLAPAMTLRSLGSRR
ncbi:Glycosyl hydrolase family 20, domain 2 [Sphingomonas gellani]|uniref:Glycosyl hydrolase family 20, domain 2 n=1 Tax=Sphingomonas gellani TaxID=1166340 RepID=A0A1H8DYD7_9SPHN|nr:glycoside hydrolase family 20 zincin-like fold domain-containing protein [Sphingomonas gellani]SEN12329.1 Glycosyl hydrolase family 20, domain 2 [Sphingomonas gellani]